MILVTGGSGFLGKELCRQLTALGESVLDFSLEGGPADGYLSLVGDICDKDSLARIFKSYPITKVAHLACLLHTQARLHPDQAYQVNVVGSANLLELSLKTNVKRFVFGSTVDAIGWKRPEECPADESAALLPADFYGETKRFIEQMGLSYAGQFQFQFISARIPVLVGPGAPTATSSWRMDLFNKLRCKQRDGGEIKTGFDPEETIPLAHVANSAAEIVQLLVSPAAAHRVYNTPAESWCFADLAKVVERINPAAWMSFGKQPVDFCPRSIDWSRFKADFDYSPMPLTKRMAEYRSPEGEQ